MQGCITLKGPAAPAAVPAMVPSNPNHSVCRRTKGLEGTSPAAVSLPCPGTCSGGVRQQFHTSPLKGSDFQGLGRNHSPQCGLTASEVETGWETRTHRASGGPILSTKERLQDKANDNSSTLISPRENTACKVTLACS